MKQLKAGSKKYLLIDQKIVDRNAERAKAGQPIVLVIEIDPKTGEATPYRASSFEALGSVRLEYAQTRLLKLGRGVSAHAAFVTDGEVILDGNSSAAPAEPKATKKTSPKTAPKD